MLRLLRGLRAVIAMVVRDAAGHQDWTWRRAFELVVLPPLLLITHLPLHGRVRKVGELAPFRRMTERQPRFLLKYINNLYLARGLKVKERGSAFIHHYHFLATAFDEEALLRLQDEGVTIFAATENDSRYEVKLSLAYEYFNEGEMTMRFLADDEIIYISSFAIVPGWVLRIDAGSALLVTRQQGSRGKFKAIARATKDLMDLPPQFILFSALQGIAIMLGISYVASVSGARHISNFDPDSPLFRKAYDEFMVSQGAVGSAKDLYRLQIPVREKGLRYIKREHRTRTVRKRRYRARVVQGVRDRLSPLLRSGFPPVKGS